MGRLLIVRPEPALKEAIGRNTDLREHEVEYCGGDVEAVRRVRRRAIDVVVTDPSTFVDDDLALAAELRHVRPSLKLIVLAPATTHEDVVRALRAHVFACFTAPFEHSEIVSMAKAALDARDWQDGIQVISGLPHWMTLRVSCHLLTAERLVRFMHEHASTLEAGERDLLLTAFREMLLNAMEHGAGFDAEKVIEVTAAKTARAIVYHFRDPGGGFDRSDLAHAAMSDAPEAVIASAIHRAEQGLRPGGFGLLIARQIADELVYNERGNELLLIKYLDS
jgi:anti-sigma regulatory factor (Ser/Thr protein kinase)